MAWRTTQLGWSVSVLNADSKSSAEKASTSSSAMRTMSSKNGVVAKLRVRGSEW